MSKAIEENKLTINIKRLLSANLYWKFMCTDKIMIRAKRTYPLSLALPVPVFLIVN